MSIHGHDVGFRRAGDAPPILLIHGIAGSSETWGQVMPLLARKYTVVAIDLIGHGQSAKPRDRDKVIPVRQGYAAHDAIPGSRLEILEGVGHFPHVEEPLRFAEILSEFMDTTEPSNFTLEDRRELMLSHDSAPSVPDGAK